MSEFVDANIFVRLLTNDDPDKARRCFELIQRANRGEIELVTSEAVVAEVVYVMSSPRLYGTSRIEIASRLGAVIVASGLRLEHKSTILDALERFGNTNLHFVDCLCVEHARRLGIPAAVYSYDRGLDRVPGVRRLEP
jgi:uncharacterized protein